MTRTRRLRRPLLGVGAVVFLLLLLTVWQAWTVRSELEGARADLRVVAEQLDAGDAQAAEAAAADARDAAARADFHSHTPVWWVSQYLPGIGDDVEAVRAVSAAAAGLTEDVVEPMVEAGFTPDQFRPANGRIAIGPLRRAESFLADAAPQIADIDSSMTDLQTDGLLGPIQSQVEELQDMLAEAARVSHAGAVATKVLPSMLGAEGRRTYLVAFQNNAEVRATGGMPGTLGVLVADNGRLSMKRTIKPGDLSGLLPKPVLPLTDEEKLVFSDRLGRYPQDTNFTPDVPRFAELLAAFWERDGRGRLDGVLSMDPVALSYLIDYTGPIPLKSDDVTLTRANTVEVLLRSAYEEADVEAQDQFFDRAARTIFSSALKASGSAEALVTALGRGIDERRVAVWSAHPDEQEQLAGEDVANELPMETGGPEIGVYYNDSAADKLSYYLRSRVEVTPESCSSAGVQKLVVDVRLRSTAPKQGLPDSAIGPGIPGQPRGVMRNTLHFFAPAGGRVDEVTVDGEDTVVSNAELEERPVANTTIDLAPGERKTIQYVVYSGSGQDGDVRLLATPLADGTGGEAFVDSGCD